MAFNWKNRPLFIGQPKIAGLGEAETLDAVYRPDSRFQGITNNLHPNLLMASTATDIDQTSAIEPEGIVGPKTLYPSMFEDPEGLKETFKDEEFKDVGGREGLGFGDFVTVPGLGKEVTGESGQVWKSTYGTYLKLNADGGSLAEDVDGNHIDIPDEVRAAQGEEVAAMDISEDVAAAEERDAIANLANQELFTASEDPQGDAISQIITQKLTALTEGEVDTKDWNSEAKKILGLDPDAPQMPDWGIPLAMIGLELMSGDSTGSILGDIAKAGKQALPLFASVQQQRKQERMAIGKLAYELKTSSAKTKSDEFYKLLELQFKMQDHALTQKKHTFEKNKAFSGAMVDLVETIPQESRLDVMTYLPKFNADMFEKYGINVQLTADDIAQAPLWFAGALRYGIESGQLDKDILKSTKDYKTQYVSWTDDGGTAWKQLHTINTRTRETVHKWGSPIKAGTASNMFYLDPKTDTIISASGLDADKMVKGLMDAKTMARLNEVRKSTITVNKIGHSLLDKLATDQGVLKIGWAGDMVSLWAGLSETSKATLGSWFASDESNAILNDQLTKGLTFNGKTINSLQELKELTSIDAVAARWKEENNPNYKLISNVQRLIGDKAAIYSDVITLGFAIANAREPGKLTDKDIAYALRTVGFDETRSFISPWEFAVGLVNGIALINDGTEVEWTEGNQLEERYSITGRMRDVYGIDDMRMYQSGNQFFPDGSQENLANLFKMTLGDQPEGDNVIIEQGTKNNTLNFPIGEPIMPFFTENKGIYGYNGDKTAIKPYSMWPKAIRDKVMNMEDKQMKKLIMEWLIEYQKHIEGLK